MAPVQGVRRPPGLLLPSRALPGLQLAAAGPTLSSIWPEMLEFLFRPLRSVLGVAERELETPIVEAEREIIAAVEAIQRATESIEHHVEVIEGLATAVGPLTDSVNQLTKTLADVVTLLAPMAEAEHEVDRVKRFFGFSRHAKPAEPEAGQLEP